MSRLQRFASLMRRYRLPRNAVVLPGPFWQDDRNCYVAPLPSDWTSDEEDVSTIVLLEDGEPLGRGHHSHDDVRALGRGRFSHWGSTIFFSTSDNSDPNTNRRVYSIIPPEGWEGTLETAAVAPKAPPRTVSEAPPRAERVAPDLAKRRVERVIPPEEILPIGGNEYSFSVPLEWMCDSRSVSTLILLENQHPLPHPHSWHSDIEKLGRGRYSHWQGEVRFAASDNSDPRSNGKTYMVRQAEALAFSHALAPPVLDSGYCYRLGHLPSHWTSDVDGKSCVVLLENGSPLGPAHCGHEEIRQIGGGRYSHWGTDLLFSTSDNSAPDENGRVYTAVLAD
jgi:hypothetical protein